MTNKAVVLGANYYIGLSIIRCLGMNGINVTAIDYSVDDRYAFHSKYLKEKLIAPDYKVDPEGFLKFLLDYAKKQEKKPVLYPTADPYVEFIDKYFNELKEAYLLPNMEKGKFTQLLSKDSLEELASSIGVLVPETFNSDEENLIEKVNEIIKYPCLVKPVDSHKFVATFRNKMFKVYNDQELLESIDKANRENLEVIVQRIIPGFDDHMYTYDAYINDNLDVTHWVTCQKFRQYPINFGASVYTGQRYVPQLHEIGRKFFKQAGFKGFAEIEFKKDSETGQYYLIEVNVRTSNLNNLLFKTGLNMPYIAYRELTGAPMEPKAIEKDTNIVFWYAYEDFFAVKSYLKTGQLKLGPVIKSYFKPKAYAIWSAKDPVPFMSFSSKVLKRAIKKVFR